MLSIFTPLPFLSPCTQMSGKVKERAGSPSHDEVLVDLISSDEEDSPAKRTRSSSGRRPPSRHSSSHVTRRLSLEEMALALPSLETHLILEKELVSSWTCKHAQVSARAAAAEEARDAATARAAGLWLRLSVAEKERDEAKARAAAAEKERDSSIVSAGTAGARRDAAVVRALVAEAERDDAKARIAAAEKERDEAKARAAAAEDAKGLATARAKVVDAARDEGVAELDSAMVRMRAAEATCRHLWKTFDNEVCHSSSNFSLFSSRHSPPACLRTGLLSPPNPSESAAEIFSRCSSELQGRLCDQVGDALADGDDAT